MSARNRVCMLAPPAETSGASLSPVGVSSAKRRHVALFTALPPSMLSLAARDSGSSQGRITAPPSASGVRGLPDLWQPGSSVLRQTRHDRGRWEGLLCVLFAISCPVVSSCTRPCSANSLLQLRCHGAFSEPRLYLPPFALGCPPPPGAAVTSCTVDFSTVCEALSHSIGTPQGAL